jgi:hydrogenase expression/formation protein HypE
MISANIGQIVRDRAAGVAGGAGRVLLAHGGGGQLTDELLRESILPHVGNGGADGLLDAAVVEQGEMRMAMTTDSYVVQPLEFPGGDIGALAVCGSVNDLAVCGAQASALSLGLILSEGLDRGVLERVMRSIGRSAREAGVRVVTGDTKVVEKHGLGVVGEMYINTTAVGVAGPYGLHPSRVRAGDVVLINGPIGEHGLAVMLAREMPEVESVLRSDVAPLNGMISRLLERVPGVRFMRDATRGGLSCVCAELAERTGLRVVLEEERIPVRPAARHAAEMLGLDVLEVANEGKVVVVVAEADVDAALEALRVDEHGRGACVIGLVEEARGPEDAGTRGRGDNGTMEQGGTGGEEGRRDYGLGYGGGVCELRTRMGGRRVVLKPYGEQLPRIC